MKLKITTLILASVAFFSACDELNIVNYDLNFATAAITIKSTTVADTTYTLESEAINPKAELENNGISSDVLKEATIKSARIDLVSPETGNFDWAKGATIKVSADGQPLMEIAKVEDIPEGLKSFEISTLDIDLLPYLKAGEFKLFLEGTTDQQILVDHEVTITVVFNVSI
ncbi:MAG: hypothetical protein H6607_07930 [Flavobacteriales bacterium]|nr:hypothetical protein [Flavobacteriales bacterium]